MTRVESPSTDNLCRIHEKVVRAQKQAKRKATSPGQGLTSAAARSMDGGMCARLSATTRGDPSCLISRKICKNSLHPPSDAVIKVNTTTNSICQGAARKKTSTRNEKAATVFISMVKAEPGVPGGGCEAGIFRRPCQSTFESADSFAKVQREHTWNTRPAVCQGGDVISFAPPTRKLQHHYS